jgi:N-acetylglutamate synthase-like GNAT family acetyltransferase
MLLCLIKFLIKEEQDLNSNLLKSDSIKIVEPQTKEQFEAYFLLRYEVLRKPWNQPPGSEKDDQEDKSIHIMATLDNAALGVCRLQLNSPSEAQLRYMGVQKNTQGLGIGRKLIAYAENKAKQKNCKKIILHSRETAVEFYEKCGYSVAEKSYLMWGEIQHYLMEKEL